MMTATLTSRPSTTNENPWAKGRPLVVAAGPVLLTAALRGHPPLPGRLPDSAGAAAAAATDITRWGLSHLALALASGAVGLGLVLIGSAMLAVLPGMEFAVVPAHGTGADVAALLALLPLAVAIGTARLRTSRTP